MALTKNEANMGKLIFAVAAFVAFCTTELSGETQPPCTEVSFKGGVGMMDMASSPYPAFTSGIGVRPKARLYGCPVQIGLDGMQYADTTRQQSAGWLKSVVILQHDKIPTLRNFYTGLGFSLGAIDMRLLEKMTPEYQDQIRRELAANPSAKRDEFWDPSPEDRLLWNRYQTGGVFFEAVFGFEWFPVLTKDIVGADGKIKVTQYPIRMFVELSLHHGLFDHKLSLMDQSPYMQIDLGVGF